MEYLACMTMSKHLTIVNIYGHSLVSVGERSANKRDQSASLSLEKTASNSSKCETSGN